MGKWLDNAVFYEIYPQSFQDSDSDGIGDIQGIIRRLDYIRDLGCNAIWMNPCFDSPFTDAGYDVADYYRVAPRYGTNDDLKQLFEEVHKRDMHLLLDLVPGHTSVNHPWFQESMKAEQNEYSKRYIWTDSVWSDFSQIKNLTGCIRGISDRNGSCATNFFSTQPALNYGFANPTESWQSAVDSQEAVASRRAMEDIMAFWLSLGCDGFRVDMAGAMIKQDEDGSATVAFWQKVRKFLDETYPDAVLISEWGEPDKSLAGGFHMDFLLHFGPSHYLDLFRAEYPYFSREGKGDISAFAQKYMENYRTANGNGLICIPSSNHDMPRIADKLDEEELKIAFAFLLSMPGAPFIYYGDEIGMRYLHGLTSVEGGYERTGTRTPMQWDDSANAGFSCAAKDMLYIMQDPSPDRPTVKSQMTREDSLYHEIRKLIRLRMENEALQSNASIDILYAKENQYPFVYKRSTDTDSVLVILNPSDKTVSCTIEATEFSASEVLYSNHGTATVTNGTIQTPACSATFLRLK